MEHEWELDRIRLYQLRRDHPNWTLKQLANAVGRCLSWVKKWLKRFREVDQPSLDMFKSQSRAPHTRPREVVDVVRDAVLALRDELPEKYGRVVGPKTILYHLHHDPLLQKLGVYLPRSTRTIWLILKAAGRIPKRVRHHHPIDRPEPMSHWEMDFGQVGQQFEFLTVIDRGTSILIDTPTNEHFNAESALLMVAQILLLMGVPDKLRFDNDTRFVGSWLTDGYPSPLMKFLVCVGSEPDLVEPGKPYLKPFAERSVRTLKHEFLWNHRPADWREAAEKLQDFRHFYNHERANQSLACDNRPPYEAFPELPARPKIPDSIDPDAWATYYHRRIFKRRVNRNGYVSIGKHDYYIDYKLARQEIGAMLNAETGVFHILHGSTRVRDLEMQDLVKETMPFQAYLQHMLTEARTTVAT